MKNLSFPIQFEFKITTLSNDFTARDANGRTIAYVRQKLLKLKEDIIIYDDESKNKQNFRIRADRWIDFNAAYSITNDVGKEIGKVGRKGWRSLWKAEYELIDQHQKLQYRIEEENGWIKVLDGMLGEIPFLGALTGYFLNPTYMVTNLSSQPVARLKKMPSFFGRRFEIDKLSETDDDDDERIILGLMMMILLERSRG